MALFHPITLLGDNLGQRHRHLNSLVSEAKESGASFQDIEALAEGSPVDRLFKIDLAIELKHVDYIIRNLKDDDMLYVSRALKSKWLIDHRDIVNPKYLEDVLFPEMMMPAVTKMKHWLYINLRDPAICQEFYQHYKENTFEFAIKFLSHCSQEFILEAVPKILTKLSTHSLKVLCEKCPRVAKIYFDSLASDEDVKTRYLKQEQSFYNSVKCVLKTDADVFLDITEKYFNMNSFSRFSPLATDYIVRYHKTRFLNKLELYVAYFLHIPTLAARLSVEECQEVVLKLARASYLQRWFEYKAVEPLIKRLNSDKRATFKKKVFVNMDIGDCEDKWPYEIPTSPAQSDIGLHIFDDQDFMSDILPSHPRMLCSAFRALPCAMQPRALHSQKMIHMKTDLERLFDEFRFIGFERALHELGQRLGVTSCSDRRRDIFLVLVSKTGGRTDAVSALLRLAARYSNEPPHTRASILRSLVKRANVWRLPADVWQHFLDFGHGLGLDGTQPEASCHEGLHSVLIRQLLAGECEQAIRDSFLKDFSTLVEYSLKGDERVRVAIGLQNMLTEAAIDVEPAEAAELLALLLVVIKTYRVRVGPTSPAVEAVVALALRDADVARPLLERLYNERIARRELMRLNMEFRRDEAALLNALRHDPSVLEPKQIVDILSSFRSSAAPSKGFGRHPRRLIRRRRLGACQKNFDKFTSKLVIYFDQNHDLTTNLRTALKEKIAQEYNMNMARVLVGLLGNNFEKELHESDAAGKQSAKFAAALRASVHQARPAFNLAEWGWRKAGVKAVATRSMRCREIERAASTRALAAERRTVKVALALSMRSSGPRELLLETFESAAKLRPVVALRAALPYFRRHGATAYLGVWDIVKPLFSSVDFSSRERLRQLLRKTEWIPSNIKPDYCIALYLALHKICSISAQQVLWELSKLLPECDESIEIILLHILNNTDKNIPAIPCPSIFVRYLLLSRNEEDVERRFLKIGNRFLERLDTLRSDKDPFFPRRLDQIMTSLKYNSAFLDTKFSSCLSVIERILDWLQKFMPKDEYFKKYTQIHLTMLYFKAVRQSMKQMPEVFANPKRRKSEWVGVEAVGFVFGRYIVKEVSELENTYFDSIIELYTDALVDYLKRNLPHGTSKIKFIGFILKGFLTEAVGIQRRMAVYVLRDPQIGIEDTVKKEIEEVVMKDRAVELFAHAELFSPFVPVVPRYNCIPIKR